MAETRLIRKYANRRLYDATGSRHVTLDDIRKMIGAGEQVKVIDDKSGEDITRSVLLKGSGIDSVWPNVLALVAFTAILLSLSVMRFRKQLG